MSSRMMGLDECLEICRDAAESLKRYGEPFRKRNFFLWRCKRLCREVGRPSLTAYQYIDK